MKRTIIKILLFLGSVIVILIPSIFNAYPILFSDTGTYIMSGIQLYVPIDRPVFYGLFLRVSSFHISLWFSVIFQVLLLNFFLLLILKNIFSLKKAYLHLLILSVLLTGLTSLAYYANLLIPDIFSAMVVLGLACIIAEPRCGYPTMIPLSLLLIFFNMMHLSNLMITISIFGIWLIIVLVFIRKQWIRQRLLSLMFLALITAGSWIILPVVNSQLGAGFVTTRVKNVFMMGSLVEKGLVKPYLDEYCAEKNYEICAHKDRISNRTSRFLWDFESPLYQGGCLKEGWESCWLEKDEEFGRIISDLIATQEYRRAYLRMAFTEGFNQLVTVGLRNLRSEGNNSPVRWPMEVCFDKKEYQRYISAYQQDHGLRFNLLSRLNKMVTLVSFMGILVFLIIPGLRKTLTVRLWLFTGIVFMALLANAFIVSVFSHVAERYQSRLSWMLPLIFACFLIQYFQNRQLDFEEE